MRSKDRKYIVESEREVFTVSTGSYKALEYRSAMDVDVIFEDGTVVNTTWGAAKRSNIRNPNYKNIFGVGCTGQGEYGSKKDSTAFNRWYRMMQRCYEEKSKDVNPTYRDVEVCESWLNFQNFAPWFYDNFVEGWFLDKDLLSGKNKIYSPSTCCFLPRELNNLLTNRKAKRGLLPIGVVKYRSRYTCTIRKYNKSCHIGVFDTPEEAFEAYKEAKELHIKNVADEWRNEIGEDVHTALYRYEVKITD